MQYTDKQVYLWSSALACDDFYGHRKRHYYKRDTATIAGKRQGKDLKTGLTHNLGGTGAVALVNILGTEPK